MCRLLPLPAALSLLTAILLTPPTAFAEPLFMGLGRLPGATVGLRSEARGISGDGRVVVGFGRNASGDAEAFVWTLEGGMRLLGDLAGGEFESNASGVSADGSVVVGFSHGLFNRKQPFMWTEDDGLVGLDLFEPGNASAVDISGDGSVIVGNSGGPNEPTAWIDGVPTPLGFLIGGSEVWRVSADGLTVVGDSMGELTRWNEDGVSRLGFEDSNSTGRGVSADGSVIVGKAFFESGVTEAFRWEAGEFERLGFLDDDEAIRRSQATDVSADGSVVVGNSRDGDETAAFIWDAENERFVCGYNPAEIADDTLLVARVTGDEDQLLATIVNYACHPTTLAWDNRLISPDYPGAMREVVEQTTGAPCVFLQGASGELGPRDGFVGDVSVADSNGRQLGYAVLQTLETAPPPRTQFNYTGPVVSGATIGTWRHEPLSDVALQEKSQWRHDRWAIDLPYREGLATLEDTRSQLELWTAREQSARTALDEAKARDARAMAERARRHLSRLEALPPGEAFPCPITLWRNGDAFFVGVEGEPYNRFQRALRERFPAAPIVVMVLAGGSRIGYLPTAETYDTGIYQESIALVASGCPAVRSEAANPPGHRESEC